MSDPVEEAYRNGTPDLHRGPRVVADPYSIQRTPPHSIEAEQGTLSCVIQDPIANIPLAQKAIVRPEVFYDLRHQTLWTTLNKMASNGGIDVITISQKLRDSNQLEAIGGLGYLSTLSDFAPSSANLPYYLSILDSKYTLRRAIHTCTDLVAHAYEDQADLDGIASFLRYTASRLSKPSETLTIRDPNNILALPRDENDRILADRLLAKGQSMTFLGAGGIGKSRLAYQFALCAITGRPFITLETGCPELRWLFIQAENSNRRLQDDLLCLRKWAGESDWAKFNDQVAIHTLETDLDTFLAVQDIDAQNRLAQTIQDQRPNVIVWDSLYNFSSGDLNSDVDMRDTLATVSRLSKQGDPERAIITLHHALAGKAGIVKSTGFDRSSFGRNSKVLHSWTRGQLNLAPGSPDDNNSIVVSCGKCSNGREFAPFAVRLDPKTMIYEADPAFDFKVWEDAVSGKTRSPSVSAQAAADCCTRQMTRKELVEAVMEGCICEKSAAYKVIAKAVHLKLINHSKISGCFFPK